MDRFEKLLNEIKENCRQQKLELFLMLLFVIAAAGLTMDELAERKGVSESAAPKSELERETESETDTELGSGEDETETGAREGSSDQLDTEIRYLTLKDLRTINGREVLIPRTAGWKEKPDGKRLEELLAGSVAGYDGDWSVYAKNLSTGEEAVVNDYPMKSASVMKLFIMGAVYKAFESGELSRTDEIMDQMRDMITYSDNTDSNRLLYDLGNSDYAKGIAKVNEFIDEYGFSSMTVEYNGFNDPETNTRMGSYNQVSARDCGRLLETIYRRELVNRQVSNEIEQMMLNQDTRYKIPAGLPDGVSCGNKTGEMDTTENDAAIIYGDNCDYILVVLSSDWSSKDEAISRIQAVSSKVYEYFEEGN